MVVPVMAAVSAGAALVLALRAGGALAVPIPGLPDPGPVTTWALPLVRLLADALATLTVGMLVTAAFLLPGDGPSVSPARLAAAAAGRRAVRRVGVGRLGADRADGLGPAGLSVCPA